MSGLHRSYTRKSTKDAMDKNASYNSKNEMLDPNENEPIQDKKVIGHPTGMEWRGFKSYGEKSGMTQAEMNNTQNNGAMLQWESASSNAKHEHEETDPNATALNTANYCYLENPQYQKSTYINPPSAEGEPWTLSVVNKQTGIESQIGTFEPDLGEVTPEGTAALKSTVSLNDLESENTCENSMNDFGSEENNTDAAESSASEGNGDNSGGSNHNDDDGMTM
ncbi:MAG: hypothetical protein IJY06_09475 [Oscillospiraceae bacterium]|nr:hypothetical protein [Oscillospiraceae bacterium]